jgi:6,7-dimethyl-8-ribityllumazine synthase
MKTKITEKTVRTLVVSLTPWVATGIVIIGQFCGMSAIWQGATAAIGAACVTIENIIFNAIEGKENIADAIKDAGTAAVDAAKDVAQEVTGTDIKSKA